MAQLPPWYGFPSGLRTYDRALQGDLRELEQFLKQFRTRVAQLISDEPISETSTIAVPTSRQVIAGAGLSGGGALTADVTLDVGAGTGISVAANTVGLANTTVTPSSYTYTSLTVDAQGRLTAASSGAAPAGLASTAPVDVDLSPASVGVGTTAARADHKHDLAENIAPTWIGVHTYSAQDIHNAGVSLGTSGVLASAVTDAASAGAVVVQAPAWTASNDRSVFAVKDNAATPTYPLVVTPAGSVVLAAPSLSGIGAASTALLQGFNLTNTDHAGMARFTMNTAPLSTGMTSFAGFGATTVNFGGWFKSFKNTSATGLVGGAFEGGTMAQNSGATWNDWWAGYFRSNSAAGTTGAASSVLTRAGGVFIDSGVGSPLPATNWLAITDWYQLLIKNALTNTKPKITNSYGISIDEQTRGLTINNGIFLDTATASYKAIAIRDQNTYIHSSAAATLDLTATTINNNIATMNCNATSNINWYAPSGFNVVFYDNEIVSYDDDMVTY